MDQVAFEMVKEGHFTWVSANALLAIADCWDAITQTGFKRGAWGWPGPLASQDPSFRSCLDILARSVAYDALIVDELALESIRQFGASPDRLQQLSAIKSTVVPREVYQQSHDQVWAYLRWLRSHRAGPTLESWLTSNDWFDHAEKEIHDRLFKRSASDSIADSNESVARLVFYLELSRLSGLPVLLSRWKSKFLRYMSDRTLRDAQSVVENVLGSLPTRELTWELSSVLQSEYAHDFEFECPPIAEMIVRTAYSKQISVLDATMRVRESKSAVAFRRWLHPIQISLMRGDRASRADALRELNRVRQIVDQWIGDADESLGVTHVRRTASLQAIPVVGWVVRLGGVGAVELKDKILDPPQRYLQFIASWFSPE